MPTNTCKTCHFWAHQIAEIGPDAGKLSESGTCRRYAPSGRDVESYPSYLTPAEKVAAVFTWPSTFAWGWCGEFAEAADAAARAELEVINS